MSQPLPYEWGENEKHETEAEDNTPLSKFGSLIHILKGHEEFRLDAGGLIISSNLEAVNITGYEEWEVLGKHISLIYQDNEKDQAELDLNRAAKFDFSYTAGIRLKKRKTPFWAKMKINALRSASNSLVGFRIILQDATHRAISSARVRTLKDEYLAIFNNPFVGAFKFRMSDYKVQLCNKKTLDILGKNESGSLSFKDFFATESQFDQFVSLLRKDKLVEGFKTTIKDPQSDENWAVISARYFEMGDFAEGVLFDISEEHNRAIELKKITKDLNSFTYHASHDLRGPIATILGLVNLARMEPFESILTYLNKIWEQAHRLDSILKDLSSVAYNNTIEVNHEKFLFEPEVSLLLEKARNAAVNISISAKIDQELDFFTDANRMRMIIWNLLLNSCSVVNNTDRQHDISLKIRVESTHVAIKMNDSLLNIEWGLKEKVWDIFFKHNGNTTSSGVCLYAVKSIVEKLKGTICFESTPSEGTTFLTIIPNLNASRGRKTEIVK